MELQLGETQSGGVMLELAWIYGFPVGYGSVGGRLVKSDFDREYGDQYIGPVILIMDWSLKQQ